MGSSRGVIGPVTEIQGDGLACYRLTGKAPGEYTP